MFHSFIIIIIIIIIKYVWRQTKEIARKMTWTWLRRENLKRETESILIAAQNKALNIDYIKVKIDIAPKNSEWRSHSVKDRTVNHIISECVKLAQKKYKTRYDLVR